MFLTIAFTLQARIGFLSLLIDGVSFQIREPRLDVSGWDEDRHAFISLTSFHARFEAGALNLYYSGSNVPTVGIDQHNQSLLNSVLSCSVIVKFLDVSEPDILLSRTSALGTDLNPLHSDALACSLEEPARKCLVLTILAQDDDLDVAARFYHPLAMTSDSLSPPSTAISLDGRTVVAPELSRLRTSPRSLPR